MYPGPETLPCRPWSGRKHVNIYFVGRVSESWRRAVTTVRGPGRDRGLIRVGDGVGSDSTLTTGGLLGREGGDKGTLILHPRPWTDPLERGRDGGEEGDGRNPDSFTLGVGTDRYQ